MAWSGWRRGPRYDLDMKVAGVEKAFRAINEMVKAGVVRRYALGGAMGALFYSEPVVTYDLDVFVALGDDPARSPLTPLAPIYEFARSRGFAIEREHVVIEGIPVQFLPAPSPLVEEAIEKALLKRVGNTLVRVMTPEHLAAVMVEVGRPKDKLRLESFFSGGALDREVLEEILRRHGLHGRWSRIRKEIGVDGP